jgi:heme oxygenase
MSAHAILRARTAADHATTDAAFSRFDLGDRQSYLLFLLAHGRALPAIEEALAREPSLPAWRPRAAFLAEDLKAFGQDLPAPLRLEPAPGPAESLGLLYVMEGSRLGGRVLLGRVAPGFSSHYLAATHEPGEWRAFTARLDERGAREGPDWLDRLVAGARLGFQLASRAATGPPLTT